MRKLCIYIWFKKSDSFDEESKDCVREADLLASVRDWALPKAKVALNLSDSFCKDYLDTFYKLYPNLPRQIIHRDPNPGNIIRADDQRGFIDFELAERNVRIYDPCYARLQCFLKPLDSKMINDLESTGK